MIFRIYLKNAITNKATWGWGIFFMIFWLFMGAYVFSTGIPKKDASSVVSSYFGLFGLISFCSIATGFAFVIMYSSRSLPYAFRYSSLRPSVYIRDFLGSFLVTAMMFSSILIAATFLIFSNRFGEGLAPYSVAASLAVSAFSGVFLASLDLVLVAAIINYLGLKSMQFASLIPLIITYALVFPAIFLKVPALLYYISPFNAFYALLFSSYSGIWLSGSNHGFFPPVNEYFCLISVMAWTAVLLLVSMNLIRRIKPTPLEEARPI